jgi:hypothetical protein
MEPKPGTAATISNEPQKKDGSERRRSQRVALRIPVVVIGTDTKGRPFGEVTHTVIVNAHGALVELKAEVGDDDRVLLRNKISGQREPCRVVWFRKGEAGNNTVGLEFQIPAPQFWGIQFPPEDWLKAADSASPKSSEAAPAKPK